MSMKRTVLAAAFAFAVVAEAGVPLEIGWGEVDITPPPTKRIPLCGQIIKARSAAVQTFIVEKCGSGGYVPTLASENSVGYSGGINVGKVGHEGAYRFCDLAVDRINGMFNEK